MVGVNLYDAPTDIIFRNYVLENKKIGLILSP